MRISALAQKDSHVTALCASLTPGKHMESRSRKLFRMIDVVDNLTASPRNAKDRWRIGLLGAPTAFSNVLTLAARTAPKVIAKIDQLPTHRQGHDAMNAFRRGEWLFTCQEFNFLKNRAVYQRISEPCLGYVQPFASHSPQDDWYGASTLHDK